MEEQKMANNINDSKNWSFYNSIKPSYDFGHKRYFAPYMPGRSKILSFINI